jgi:hypothetical protein
MGVMKRERAIDPRKAAAIKLSIDLGRRLQQDFPQIADDYRDLMTRGEIIEKYRICGRYGISIKIAKPAVSYAMRGYNGKEKVGKHTIQRYSGLISDKNELVRIYLALREKGLEYMVDEKIGIHAQTDEEKRIISSEGGVNNAINRGFIPWSEEELEEAQRCSQLRRYWSKKKYAGHYRVNNALIAKKLNELFHNGETVREEYGVRIKLCKYRMKLKQ